MIIEIEKGHPETVALLKKMVAQHGNSLETIEGSEVYDTLHLIGDARPLASHKGYIQSLPGVNRCWRISSGYKNIARVVSGGKDRAAIRETRVVEVPGPDGKTRKFGAEEHIFIVGPDSVQTEEQTRLQAQRIADLADRLNIRHRVMFRAGAFKPRTRPTDFRGLGLEAIKILDQIREETGIPYVSEVMDHTLVEQLAEHLDCFQIGTRNAQDFKLLETVGATGKPVILKRGFGNDAEEWFNAAEYIANQNNLNIMLCERGVKTMFAGKGYNRFTPDMNVIRYAQKKTILPVLFDPSHSAGDDRLVAENVMASLAYEPAGTLTEVIHDEEFRPVQMCDASQALHLDVFEKMVEAVLKYESDIRPLMKQTRDYFERRASGAGAAV